MSDEPWKPWPRWRIMLAYVRQWWHCLIHFHQPMTAWTPYDGTDFLCRDCGWSGAPRV